MAWIRYYVYIYIIVIYTVYIYTVYIYTVYIYIYSIYILYIYIHCIYAYTYTWVTAFFGEVKSSDLGNRFKTQDGVRCQRYWESQVGTRGWCPPCRFLGIWWIPLGKWVIPPRIGISMNIPTKERNLWIIYIYGV